MYECYGSLADCSLVWSYYHRILDVLGIEVMENGRRMRNLRVRPNS